MKRQFLRRLIIPVALLLWTTIAGAQQEGRLPVISDEAKTATEASGRIAAKQIAQKVQQPASAAKSSTALVAAPDVLVNNNNGFTTISQFTQSETSTIAWGNFVVTAYNDAGSFATAGGHFTGWSYSSDGGVTFTDGGVLPNNALGDAGDPLLVRNSTTGRIYLFTLGFNNGNTIPCFRSDDNGVTWQPPVNSTPGGSSEDKPWAEVDNYAGGGNGNVYLLSRNFGVGNGIYFFKSTDHGSTWSAGTLIASGVAGNVQGTFITVSPNHALHAFYFDDLANNIKVRKSTDFGATWGAAVVVVAGLPAFTNGGLGLTGSRQGLPTASGFRSSSFPHAVSNPINGNLYLVYNNDGPGVDRADVLIVQSTDGGATWSAPVKVNDDATTTDQWMPTIAITADGGQLGVFYYSRQEDAVNNNLFKYYGRFAALSGATTTFVGASFAVSDVASFPEFGRDATINAVYMGDYNTVATTPGFYHVVWSDNRSDLPGGVGRKDPNVYYKKVTAFVMPTGPNISVAPAAINFGDVGVGQTAGPTLVTITNIGDQPLTISSISTPGGDFTLSGLPGLPLPLMSLGTVTFNVSFTPSSGGLKTANVTITSNAVNTPSYVLSLQGTGIPPPANDLCANAIAVSCGSSVTGNTSFATTDAAPICSAITNTSTGVWYTITGTGAPITASTCTGTTFNTKLSVYSGTCAALVCTAANDNFCSTQSQVTWTSVAGTVYYILVHGDGSSKGAFTLNVTCAPLITVTPSPLVINVPLNGTGSGILNIANTAVAGSQDLNWSTVGDVYQFKDSDAPGGPVFNWTDISGTGTAVTLTDDASVDVPLPFTFTFFGNAKTTVKVSSNGFLTFGTNGTSFTNVTIPTAVIPNDNISLFWDDLNPALGGTIHHFSSATQFIVQYTNIRRFGGTLPNTFQVILNADGSILYQYLNMQDVVNSATVGIENATGTAGLLVAFNTAYIHNNLAVLINVPSTCSWISSVTPAFGTTAATATTPATVAVNATGLLCGVYNCNITVKSNAFNAPSVVVPVVLNVGDATCSITSIPSNNVYTGGVPTNLYIGYGPQSTTLQANVAAECGPFTYAWSGGTLSNYNTANPVFTATTPGAFTFTVVITNGNGFSATCNITINVFDVRVPGSNGKKVYLCHVPGGNPANKQTLAVSVNAVPEHLTTHPGDKLGNCDLVIPGARNPLFVVSEETPASNEVITYPNPNNGNFDLQLKSWKSGRVEIRIINKNGVVIERKMVNMNNKTQTVRFNLRSHASGMYVVQIVGNEGVQYSRFVINR